MKEKYVKISKRQGLVLFFLRNNDLYNYSNDCDILILKMYIALSDDNYCPKNPRVHTIQSPRDCLTSNSRDNR